ncbi:receptor 12 [Olea europaea subsp. europaea]|uniref:Receptor 12 n=1 Tax=Olea europaea subsp. europaea TaxID=158383 RepID=A0A8S0TBS4_OLEEU|nr:receptor 12 [Olea europaea subsp. europaea]
MISLEVGHLKSLVALDLSMKQLSGQLPKNVSKLGKGLRVLNLNNNNFHDTIPKIFPKGCELQYLDLYGNQLSETLPLSSVNCRMLEVLDIGNNNISSPFPFWMETLPKLRVLVLKSNRFHNIIPISKVKPSFSKLRILDMSHNEFTGVLPIEFLDKFKAMMNVSENEIGAEYSDVLSTVLLKGFEYGLRSIQRAYTSIDLSNNKFQAKIPSSIGKFNGLHALNLAYNNFTGHIPSLENLNLLESLDLRSNQLVGDIPWQLRKLKSLSFLNLSYNHLVGSIPEQGQFFMLDSSSYIGNPELCGLPLTNMCRNDDPQPKLLVSTTQKDDDFNILDRFTSQVVLMGYGCGMLFGMVAGYLIFKYEKPEWFI